jgi:hypothetical protein
MIHNHSKDKIFLYLQGVTNEVHQDLHQIHEDM